MVSHHVMGSQACSRSLQYHKCHPLKHGIDAWHFSLSLSKTILGFVSLKPWLCLMKGCVQLPPFLYHSCLESPTMRTLLLYYYSNTSILNDFSPFLKRFQKWVQSYTSLFSKNSIQSMLKTFRIKRTNNFS